MDFETEKNFKNYKLLILFLITALQVLNFAQVTSQLSIK